VDSKICVFRVFCEKIKPSFSLSNLSAFSAFSARHRIIALRIENPYNILRQIANLPQLSLPQLGSLELTVDS
jgi:hypothetical protein